MVLPLSTDLRILMLLAGAVSWLASAEDAGDILSMLQLSARVNSTGRGLAMAYLPYNFGHTVAVKAASSGLAWGDCGDRSGTSACLGFQTSNVTGCHLMYTPAKQWPADLAKEHFGGRSVFGILRDPYERMVAQFRGSGARDYPELHAACDVSEAVKRRMRSYLDSVRGGNPYVSDCMMLPQAEYFEQPYGATLVVDNRLFPQSMNEVLVQHGLPEMVIQSEEVSHVSGCDHVWAGDLDSEAKALVRRVYQRDFDLLCSSLGHCDVQEDICLTHVPGMCPPQLFEWDSQNHVFLKRR